MASEEGDPRLPKVKKIKVGVFPRVNRKGQPLTPSAYTTWYNPEWKGCCEHIVFATNGTEAKKVAIAEHRENCNG